MADPVPAHIVGMSTILFMGRIPAAASLCRIHGEGSIFISHNPGGVKGAQFGFLPNGKTIAGVTAGLFLTRISGFKRNPQ